MRMVGYKNAESIKEGFDSGMIFPSAKYNMKKNNGIINKIESCRVKNASPKIMLLKTNL